MSKGSKLYRLNADVYKSMSAQIAKLPKQQQQILATMSAHCIDAGLKGSDIVDLAKKAGLETRQKSTVLYAWYARSNEAFGVYSGEPVVTVASVPAEKPAKIAKSA